MSSDDTLVSVIVPAFNAETTICDTLISVQNQTHRNLEIIVIDDGSVDRTHELSCEHARFDDRIRVISQRNAGVAAARNRGIEEAQADVVAPVDADDLWRPTKIARQLRALRAAGPEVGLVYSWSALIDEAGKVLSWGDHPVYAGDVLLALCRGNFVGNGSTALMRKLDVQRSDGFDSSLRARQAQGCEDWSLFVGLAERCHFAVVPDYLTGYRQMRRAMSRDIEQMLRSDALVRSAVLARHPEYSMELGEGRRLYIDWLFRRELDDGNLHLCFTLLRDLVRRDNGRSFSGRRATRLALRTAIRLLKGRTPSDRAKFLLHDNSDGTSESVGGSVAPDRGRIE